MGWSNYHSHCIHCDGIESPKVLIETAMERGFFDLGFSSHAPLPFPSPWCIGRGSRPTALGLYRRDIESLRRKYEGTMEIHAGLEVDYIPGLIGPADHLFASFDYTIGSVHFVGSDRRGLPWAMDDSPESFERGLVEESLAAVVRSGCILEVNTGGMARRWSEEPYPSLWALGRCRELGIPLTINSDCHRAADLDHGFAFAADALLATGYGEVVVLDGDAWRAYHLRGSGIDRRPLKRTLQRTPRQAPHRAA